MRSIHKAAAATAIAIGLLVPAAGIAAATEPNHGTTTSAAARAKTTHGSTTSAAAKAKAKAKKAHNKIVHAGTVTAVSATSITFTVHGGRDKALRGKPVTFVVTATTKVTRNDADSTIASVKVGDHVNVKGTKVAAVYTATRISASGL
ncbi:MAG: DUF5666 domain-containing protein [Mycobacteriales bacterium]